MSHVGQVDGQEPSLDGGYLRNVLRRFVAAAQRQHESRRSVQSRISGPESEVEHGVRDPRLSDSGLRDSQPTEQERLQLLKNLFAAKQRALRRYQFYNREYAEINWYGRPFPDLLNELDLTSDQRDACYPRATTPLPVSGHGQGWPCHRQK